MLDYMIVNIVKWLALMIIFFTAFACSLFLIFSYFSALVQQQNTLMQLSTGTIDPAIATTNQSSVTSSNGNCPDYFYQLLNQSVSAVVDATGDDSTNASNLDVCQQLSYYSTLTELGSHPAIYYFGQSFQSTLLTTFFTLFGVIGENGIAVNLPH